jgi:uncharacterized protein (TIGR02145 family)
VKGKIKDLVYAVMIPLIIMTIQGCSKKESDYIFFYPTYETLKDVDGNVYHMVYIKGQTWMVENLKTTRFHNGDTIPGVMDDKAWSNLSTAAWCDYENDSGKSKTYGRIYNWAAVSHGNLCPYPWHVPYDFEWQQLIDTLGGAGVAGGLLKETGSVHWQNNAYATNPYGFSALPGGYRNTDGVFGETGLHGYWWSYTYPGDYPLSRSMNFDDAMVNRFEADKRKGYSVRCIRDY